MSYDQEASRRMAQNRQQQGAALPTAAALPPPVGRAAPIDPANVPRATRAALSSPVPDEPAAEPPSEANQCVERLQRLALGTPWWSSSQRSARASASLMSVPRGSHGPRAQPAAVWWHSKEMEAFQQLMDGIQLLTWEREATAGQALTLLLKLLGHTRSHAMVMAGVEALIHIDPRSSTKPEWPFYCALSRWCCARLHILFDAGTERAAQLELLLLLLLEALCADRMGARALLSVDAVPLDLARVNRSSSTPECAKRALGILRVLALESTPTSTSNETAGAAAAPVADADIVGPLLHLILASSMAPLPVRPVQPDVVGEAFDEVCGEDALAVHSSERTLSPLQKLYAVQGLLEIWEVRATADRVVAALLRESVVAANLTSAPHRGATCAHATLVAIRSAVPEARTSLERMIMRSR